MKPTSGRIVHFVSHQRKDVPAIITAVSENETTVNLHIFWDNSVDEHPHGLVSQQKAKYDETMKTEKTWHWPLHENVSKVDPILKGLEQVKK